MKQRILVAVASVVLSALILLLLPVNKPVPDPTDPSGTTPTTPSSSTSLATQPSYIAPVEYGTVYLYTCDEVLGDRYSTLALEYFKATGRVVIVLDSDGRPCEEALADYMASDTVPTIFCIHSQEAFASMQDRLYDLTDAAITAQLYSPNFALTADGKTLAVAADISGYGLICNASLLAEAGFTVGDISGFADLNTGLSHISSNRSSLGFYPFAKPDFTDKALVGLLAKLFETPDQLRSFMDAYLQNTSSKTTALSYFLNETTAFYIGGTEDYETLSALGSNKLNFLPAYGENSDSILCASSHYLAVNADAEGKDTLASLDFLAWLATARDDGSVPIDDLGLLSPYRDAVGGENTLQKQLRALLSDHDVRVFWDVSLPEDTAASLSAALSAYSKSKTDENWAAVAALLEAE